MALAGNDMSLPVNSKTYEFTKIDKNVKFALEYSEQRLVFKPFLVTMMQNINVRTHLVLVGTSWPQLTTGTPCGSHSSHNKQ